MEKETWNTEVGLGTKDTFASTKGSTHLSDSSQECNASDEGEGWAVDLGPFKNILSVL